MLSKTVTHKCDTCHILSSICAVACVSCGIDIRLCNICMGKYLSEPIRRHHSMIYTQLCNKCSRDKQIDIICQ